MRINIFFSECASEFIEIPVFSVLPIIIFSGLLDGINPCAFAVLFFFLVFLYISRERMIKNISRIKYVGLVYIIAVYLGYLLIGLAIVEVISLTPYSHTFAIIGAVLVIIFGIVNVKDCFWPGFGPSLKIPFSQWKKIAKWMHKATIPSAFIVSLIVSIVEFPCTGGIYLAILGMLAKNTSFIQGLLYLLIYNVAFIVPLVIILILSSNKVIVEKMRKWQLSKEKEMKLVMGLVMIFLGLYLIYTGLI